MAGKKITRKQLLKEPDEFITTTGKVIRFFRENQKQVTLAGLSRRRPRRRHFGLFLFHWEEGTPWPFSSRAPIYQEAFAGPEPGQGQGDLQESPGKIPGSLQDLRPGNRRADFADLCRELPYALMEWMRHPAYAQCLDGPFRSLPPESGVLLRGQGEFAKALENFQRNADGKRARTRRRAAGVAVVTKR